MKPFDLPKKAVKEFCERWGVVTLEIFGSSATGEFSATSDVDVMVTFDEGKTPGLDFLEMKSQLEELFARPVDLVTRNAIEKSNNPYRKQSILSTARVVYDKKAA
jgi:uncharacterized protein